MGVHGMCWALLLVWEWNYARHYAADFKEIELKVPPLTQVFISATAFLFDNQALIGFGLVVFLAIDAAILYRLDHPSIRKVFRELWSGIVGGLPLMILLFSATGMNLPYLKVLANLSVPSVDEDEPSKEEFARLQGSWRLTNAERAGRPVAERATLDFQRAPGRGVQQFRWTHNGQTASGYPELDFRGKPKWITFIFTTGPDQAKRQRGIYKMAGGELILCLAPPDALGDDLPEEFATQDNDCVLYRFRRVEPGK